MSLNLNFPLHNDLSRKIIHIDMDAFFASVEERDHPQLVGTPLVIAKHPQKTGGKGVVTTANYLARQYGIHSAMSAKKAYELCPHANFVPGNYEYYQQISKQIHEIFKRYTDIVEPVALDEAYLDVTQNKINSTSAVKIAKSIQYDIFHELHLTCSAGVSYNKFIAKLASDYQKPFGFTLILPEEAEIFLQALPIEKFHGIGKKTIPKMHQMGIFYGRDLLKKSEIELIQSFGKLGYSLYRKVRGIHNSPVQSSRERKSIGRESTYARPLQTEEDIFSQLRILSSNTAKALMKHEKKGKILVLKIRDTSYKTTTKRMTLDEYTQDKEVIFFHARSLWEDRVNIDDDIRLLGITLTNLVTQNYEAIALPLWE